MHTTREDLERRYAEVTDQELLERHASGTLTELAARVAREELRRRGVPLPPPAREATAAVPPASHGAGALIPVATQMTWTEANILRSLLQSEGIAAELAHAHLAAAHHFLSASTGGVRLLVAEENLPRVAEVIAALRRGEYALDDEDAGSATRAPPA